MLGNYRIGGIQTLTGRVFHWSPRPFSELLIFAYSELANHTGRPFIAISLAACWILWLVLTFLAASVGSDRRASLLFWSAISALLLLSGPIQEMFYWPMGTFAYLPTVTGTVMVVTTVVLGTMSDASGRRMALTGLLLAGASSEIGAFFVLLAGALFFLVDDARGQWTRRVTWLAPVTGAIVVLFLVWNGRITRADEKQVDSPLYHHVGHSIHAAFDQAAKYFLLDRPALLSVPAIVLIMVGLSASVRTSRVRAQSSRWPVACLAALLATMLLACFGPDYREGGNFPWGRYGTTGRCLAVLALAVAATLVRPRGRMTSRPLGAASLGLGCLLLLGARAPDLFASYGHMAKRLAETRDNWTSARSPGPDMTLSLVQDDLVAGRLWLPPGRYGSNTSSPVPRSIMAYFRKREMEIKAPDDQH